MDPVSPTRLPPRIPSTIRRAAQRGYLESIRIGLDRIYAETAVQRWLEANRDRAAVAAARHTGASTRRKEAS